MKIKTYLLALTYITIITFPIFAQQGKVEVIGYEINEEAPLPLAKKNKEGQTFYDSRVIGSPKFYPGYLITINGEKLEGRIATFNNTSDWAFVKRAILIILDGEEKAQYLGSGTAAEIYQQLNKSDVYFDYYDGIYLERLVSGKLQLSYNPAANTSRKVSSFVSKSMLDSIGSNVIRQSIKEDLSNGKSIQESLEKAKLKSDAIQAFSEIEVVEKEYLLFDTETEETILITKNNYSEVVKKYLGACPSYNEKEVEKIGKNYGEISKTILAFNESCM